MSTTNHAENYFQTDSEIALSDRKARKSGNKLGNPLRLSSKLNAVTPDPTRQNAVYVAESGGTVRRVDLTSGKSSLSYLGASGPVTAVCTSADGRRVYGGSWDKHVYAWDASSVCVSQDSGPDLLLSGGADGIIVVYTSTPSGDIAARQVLRLQNQAIQDISIQSSSDSTTLFAATSSPDILVFSLPPLDTTLTKPAVHNINPTSIPAHDTSIYHLRFDDSGDLWTVSADKTAKRMTQSEKGVWEADTTLQHPDFVRDVVVCGRQAWVATACRDEEVRLWDVANGKLIETFSGHFEEVTGLCMVGKGLEETLVSVGIDGTLRRWKLADVGRTTKEKSNDLEKEKNTRTGVDSTLTEEEERELAELMEDEERELQELMAADKQ